jgi:transglutaminase-like putative cysteine protease
VPAFDELHAYRRTGDVDDTVREFAASVLHQAGPDVDRFLAGLCQSLYGMMDRRIRFEGAAQSPQTTLATRAGACRDLTVLFLAACRGLGMAGRFVSGYQARAQTPDGQRYLHAWAEVFRPGLGWAGWDPTHGVPVSDGHVGLCAAPEQSETMPIEGGFYGPARISTLDYTVRIATD